MPLKLSEKEREIITCMYFRADMPLRQVAKETGLKEHSVRHALDSLYERGALINRPFISPYAVGYCEHQAYFKLITPGENARKLLSTALKNSAFTTFVGNLGGEYQIECMFLTRSTSEIQTFFDEVHAAARGVEFEKTVSNCLSVTLFLPKGISSRRYSVSSLTYDSATRANSMDATDLKVLASLAHAKKLFMAQLSRQAGIPAATFEYRLKSLRRRGAILAFGLQAVRFNDGLTPYSLFAYGKKLDLRGRKKLFSYCDLSPHVTYLVELAGACDYEIGLRLKDPCQLNEVVQDLLLNLRTEISRIESTPVFEVLKLDPFPACCYESGLASAATA